MTELTSELGTFAILGFVCGPSFGALFTSIDINLGHGVVVDAYTAPGYFILVLCIVIYFMVVYFFHPSPSPAYVVPSGQGKSLDSNGHGHARDGTNGSTWNGEDG